MKKPVTASKTRSATDWEAVRLRIDETNRKLKNNDEIDPVALEQAWVRRSAKIAQKIQEEQQGEMVQFAIVGLDGELYGLDVRYIFDIRVLERITFVPRVPAWVLGVVNWRGRILSVIDLRSFWGLPPNNTPTDAKNTERLIVIQSGEMELGLRVDEAFLIESVPVSKIQMNEGNMRGINPELINGIFMRADQEKTADKSQRGQGTVILLNLPVLLADSRLVIHEEIL